MIALSTDLPDFSDDGLLPLSEVFDIDGWLSRLGDAARAYFVSGDRYNVLPKSPHDLTAALADSDPQARLAALNAAASALPAALRDARAALETLRTVTREAELAFDFDREDRGYVILECGFVNAISRAQAEVREVAEARFASATALAEAAGVMPQRTKRRIDG